MTQNFPSMTISQVALLRNDLYTGIVVDVNLKNAIETTQEIWTVYDLMENAIKDAKAIVKEYDHIECSIFDRSRQRLQLIQPE